ncbi:MAG: GTP pyrophosphokinase, partial [Fusicatenibacter sp.]|nr:GTP pyrophosphokinase [Fusicatenibacter sp.]
HLVEKLVRKRLENYAKYRKMDATNYMRYVTDLIGIRGLLLYREDWVNFHKYIIHWFKNDPEKYIRDYGRDYDQNASGYMAEPPKVHTRLGDYADIYVNWIPEENILDRKHYRAVHYIVVYRGVYIEIQIKTLFEEGWGEIDHSILYPRRKGNAMLTEFSELLNRLAGMGDEMGSFYRRLQVVPDEKFQSKETIVRKRELKPQVKAAVEKRDLNEIHTMDDAVWSILKE